ncbi:DNA-binding transcriptional ArsR family regulator [Neorhizobium huautlense]|nr:DNA-binding transcriptional ArsR family regulator [Neorhizobium huautlense]
MSQKGEICQRFYAYLGKQQFVAPRLDGIGHMFVYLYCDKYKTVLQNLHRPTIKVERTRDLTASIAPLVRGVVEHGWEPKMQALLVDPHAVVQASSLLGVMANEKRLHILDVLRQHETSVGSLAVQVGLSQSALSQHLGKLRGARLVTTRRDAQTIFYSCKSPRVRLLLKALYEIYGVEDLPQELSLLEAETLQVDLAALAST